ncbi:MAG TPA: multicopper oxidase domain-containing protein, partial [Burkholderiales bacterium]|nr:multicopper oxidase domain-containing protein [Burkholderiales bacterium]
EEETVNFGSPRLFRLTMGMMRWGINGRTFDMDGVADDEIVKLGTTEVWEFANDASAMMAMPHSMHLHGAQFRVLDRTSSGRQTGLRESIVDAGLKDTVLVLPGERVKILAPFSRYAGLFPYHCHMLEHGDAGMMRNYSVRA